MTPTDLAALRELVELANKRVKRHGEGSCWVCDSQHEDPLHEALRRIEPALSRLLEAQAETIEVTQAMIDAAYKAQLGPHRGIVLDWVNPEGMGHPADKTSEWSYD